MENSEISALKKSRITLYRAFALGRQALTEYRYTDALEQMRIVRAELSKVQLPMPYICSRGHAL